jgi:Uma2 family endonuclease
MSTVPKSLLTEAEYLARERKAEFRSEFYRGEMFAMAGASRAHILIAGSISANANLALRDRPCEVYQVDMRVKVRASGLYTYPDVVIVCGEPRFEDAAFDTLNNPTVLFEVLSESTEAYDRGAKATHYRKIPSLKEYVLVSQDEARCDRFVRQSDGSWILREILGARSDTRNRGCRNRDSIDGNLPPRDFPAAKVRHSAGASGVDRAPKRRVIAVLYGNSPR